MANYLSQIRLNNNIAVNLKDTAAHASIVNINNTIDGINSRLNGIDGNISNITERLANVKIYNVRDYGATGDGVTDDTAAFSEVADLINNNGGVLYAPAGSYIISDTVRLEHVGSSLIGDNQQATYIIQSANKPAFIFGNGQNIVVNVRVENIGIICNYSAPDGACIGITLDHCVNSLINNVVVSNFAKGIKFIHTGNSFITNSGVVSNVANSIGFYMGDQSVSISLNNIYAGFFDAATDSGIGLYSADGDIADICVNYLDVGNGAYGVYMDGLDSPNDMPPADIRLHEIVVDNCKIAGIDIKNINNRGNVLIDGGWINPRIESGVKAINLHNVNNVTICNITIQQLADSAPLITGISADTAVYLKIVNCSFINMLMAAALNAIDRFCINDNNMQLYTNQTSATGAIVLANAYEAIIDGNGIYGNYAAAIIYTSGNYAVITSNIINGSTAGIQESLTDSEIANNIIRLA